jgi:hypothetical protein
MQMLKLYDMCHRADWKAEQNRLMKSRGVFWFHKLVQLCQRELLIGETQVVDIKGVWASRLHCCLCTTDA